VRAGREALYAPPRTPDEEAFLAMRDSVLAAEEIAGTIASSDKDRGLLSMFGGPSRGTRRPAIIVSHDTFSELHRFLARGEPVRIEARVENRFTPALIAHNVVAELRGASKPGEIVLLGAHLDSWDLATGATDNGAGVVAVADALRAVAKGARPARTFRVALFAGEEQGLLGSTAYVTRHAAELAHHQAVLVVDNGSGRISGVTLQGWEELRAAWERLLAPLTAVGPLSIEHRTRTGSDHLPFLRAGVPAYLFNQEWRSYDWTWHTQADGYDQVVPDELPQIGAVLAAVGWGLANAERLIPRRAP
jgi:carboxypeptidase Q